MIVCGDCGEANDEGRHFCVSCGAFLEWSAAPGSSQPPAADQQAPVSMPGEPGGDTSTAAEPADPAAGTEDPASSATQQLPARPQAEPSDRGTEEGAGPPQPPQPPRPAQPDVTARQPSEAEPARRRSRQAAAPADAVAPGESACPACGTGNPPGRLFCRRCGVSLTAPEEAEEPAPHVPWWRRLLGRRSAGAQPVAAGERPARPRGRGRRLAGRVLLVVVLLAVIGAVVVVAGPWRDAVIGAVEDAWEAAFADVVAVAPAGAEASSYERATAGHATDRPPGHAIDGFSNTWWAEGAPADGVGEVLTVRFDEPTELDHIGVRSGNAEGFADHPRPREVRLGFSDGGHRRLRLADDPAFQDFEVDVDATEWVRIEIRSVYPGESDHAAAAISEVEFFAAQ